MFTIFDHSRKIYAAIHNSWLLLYWSSSSSKPFYVLHLRYYDAQQNEADINESGDSRNETFTLITKKKASFKLFHTINKDKTFNVSLFSHRQAKARFLIIFESLQLSRQRTGINGCVVSRKNIYWLFQQTVQV